MSIIGLKSPYSARVWLDELPSLRSESHHILEKKLQVSRSVGTRNVRMAAIEVFIPRGGRFIYGLLGVEFAATDSAAELLVQVSCSQTGDVISDWSLARGLDVVKAGIPPWAAEEILSAAIDFAEAESVGPGCLRLALGAHGELGSNRWVFRGLANAVTSLVSSEDRSLAEEQVSSVLQQYLC
jgi:hypothetical protein